MQLALREFRDVVTERRFIAALVAVWLICSVVAPFGTGQTLSLGARILYWFAVTAISFSVSAIVSVSLIRNPAMDRFHRLLPVVAGALLIGLSIGVLVWQLNRMIWGDVPELPRLWSYFGMTVPIALVVAFAIAFGRQGYDSVSVTESAATESPFLRRLPQYLGKRLISVSVNDHYVEAVTNRGKHLVLMRFGDALDELRDAGGMQVHRSHWIALRCSR